jgi:hypothetical protein
VHASRQAKSGAGMYSVDDNEWQLNRPSCCFTDVEKTPDHLPGFGGQRANRDHGPIFHAYILSDPRLPQSMTAEIRSWIADGKLVSSSGVTRLLSAAISGLFNSP